MLHLTDLSEDLGHGLGDSDSRLNGSRTKAPRCQKGACYFCFVCGPFMDFFTHFDDFPTLCSNIICIIYKCMCVIPIMKKKFNSEAQQYRQHQLNEQSPLTSNH